MCTDIRLICKMEIKKIWLYIFCDITVNKLSLKNGNKVVF